jgi:hypothetical protein
MSISYKTQVEGDLLRVVASGQDESVEEVTAYGMAVLQEILENNVRRVLSDERHLVYSLDVFDSFEAARTLAEAAPKVLRIAIVCRPQDLVDGEFYATVGYNRGVQVRMFTDIDAAEKWVCED